MPLLVSSVPAAGIASLAAADPHACPHRVARVRISARMPVKSAHDVRSCRSAAYSVTHPCIPARSSASRRVSPHSGAHLHIAGGGSNLPQAALHRVMIVCIDDAVLYRGSREIASRHASRESGTKRGMASLHAEMWSGRRHRGMRLGNSSRLVAPMCRPRPLVARFRIRALNAGCPRAAPSDVPPAAPGSSGALQNV